MRNVLISIALVIVFVFATEVQAQDTEHFATSPEYVGLVCESEMLARSIGDGFAEGGYQVFDRRAGIAIAFGNGCHYIGPYTLPRGTTTEITSWVYDGHQLTLCLSRIRNAKGTEDILYGYLVTEIQNT